MIDIKVTPNKNTDKNTTSHKFKQDLGITPTGQLNNYNRSIGQLLKGAAKLRADRC